MNNSAFQYDFNRTQVFYQKNKPLINDLFKKNTELFTIEFDNSILSKLFDKYSGIDYLLVRHDNQKLYGISARVNFNEYHHKSLTIRYKRRNGSKTEYQKRLSNLLNNHGSIYPSIQLQLDSDKEYNLLRAVLLNSDKFYLYIHNNFNCIKQKYLKTNFADGNLFLKFSYSEIESICIENKIPFSISNFKNNNQLKLFTN